MGIKGVVPVGNTRIYPAWMMDRPLVIVAILKIIPDIAGLGSDIQQSTRSALEQNGQIKTTPLYLKIPSAGKGGILCFIQSHHVISVNFSIPVDILEFHVARFNARSYA